MLKKTSIFLILSILLMTGVNAGVILDSISKYELSVKAAAMGDAFTAAEGDASSIMYNPAGLGDMDYSSSYFVNTDRFGMGVDDNLFIYALPLKGGTFAFGYLKEDIGDIPETDTAGNIIGYLDVKKTLMTLGYSKRLNKNSTFGINFKMLDNDLAGLTGDGFAMDFGYKRKINRKYTFGINLQDAVNSFDWDSGRNDSIPMTMRLGATYTSRLRDLKVNLDYIEEADSEGYMSFGGEYKVSDMFTLRGGMKDGDVTLGFGINYDDWIFDYSQSESGADTNVMISATMNMKKVFANVHREVERYRDGQVIRKAKVVPQDRASDYSNKIEVSSPIKAILDKYSVNSNETEKVDKEIEMKKRELVIPEEAKMHYKLGNTFLLEEVFVKAIEEYKKAIDIYPSYAQAHYNLAALYEKMDIKEKSIYEYQLVIQIDPYNVNAYIALGNLYLAMDNINDAIRYYNKVIIIAPGSESAGLAEEKIKNIKVQN